MGRISMGYVRYVLSMKYGSVLTCELKYVSGPRTWFNIADRFSVAKDNKEAARERRRVGLGRQVSV